MSKPVFTVVEIGDNPMLLLIAGVFVVTFITVCAVAYVLLAKRRTHGPGATLRLIRFRGQFPKGGYDVHDGRHETEAAPAQLH